MITVVIGGSGSGKSEYAENLIVSERNEMSRQDGARLEAGISNQNSSSKKSIDGAHDKNCENTLIYLATMQPFDKETELKIQRHQRMRQNKSFTTIECFTGLDKVPLQGRPLVLLECMSNLVANEMFSDHGAKENTLEAVLLGVDHLARQAEHLVIVTNNLFEDGCNYDEFTLHYLRTLGKINRKICLQADRVIEVVHGIPLPIKPCKSR